MIGNKLEISMLCDIYGSLLTPKQRDAVELYCNEDYSLAEIAEHTGISRQGVRDQIKHAKEQLLLYENALGLMTQRSETAKLLGLLSEAPAIKQDSMLSDVVRQLQNRLNPD